jgi:cytoskeletal protein RodZ
MTQALYAHMNNKRKKNKGQNKLSKKKILFSNLQNLVRFYPIMSFPAIFFQCWHKAISVYQPSFFIPQQSCHAPSTTVPLWEHLTVSGTNRKMSSASVTEEKVGDERKANSTKVFSVITAKDSNGKEITT